MPVTMTLSPMTLKALAEYRDSCAEMRRLIHIARTTPLDKRPPELAKQQRDAVIRVHQTEENLACIMLLEAEGQSIPGFESSTARKLEAVCH